MYPKLSKPSLAFPSGAIYTAPAAMDPQATRRSTRPSAPSERRRSRLRARLATVVSVLLVAVGGMTGVGEAARSASAAPARRPPATNWVLAKAITGSAARISVDFAIEGHGTGDGPVVIGVGLASRGGPNPFSYIDVARFGGGSPSVALAAGPNRQQDRLEVLHDDGGTFWTPSVSIDNEAKTIAFLFFAVNGVIDDVTWRPAAGSAPFRSSVRRGSGATALMVGSPSGGATLSGGSAGAGFATYERRVPTGIAGAMEWLSCQACAGTWTSPDGRSRTWAHARNHAYPVCWCSSGLGVKTAFAGAAGDWAWSWSGLSAPPGWIVPGRPADLLGEPAAAAYAPIGRDWVLFRECVGGQGCAAL